MKQEEKELLLKDLSARLPYAVYISPVDCGKAILIGIKDGNPFLWDTIHKKEYDKPWDIEYIKPYLRPMSSMTEKEKEELNNYIFSEKGLRYFWFDDGIMYSGPDNQCFIGLGNDTIDKMIDWLNKHHFDYRGLIERGLALETPEGMYNIKEE